jgi:hypothetical protein
MPKNKAPITRIEALSHLRRLQAKYEAMQAAKHSEAGKPAAAPSQWDGEHLIEETLHARLYGDIAQSLADLIQRISDVEPAARGCAHKKAISLSKKGYGSLRARKAKLAPPAPDHVSEWNGEFLMSSARHYAALAHFCNKLANLIETITAHPQRMAA